jgi:serine/threonine-protein kinase PknG
MSLDIAALAIEIKALRQMKKTRSSKGVTEVTHYDILLLKNFQRGSKTDTVCGYYVMPRYSMNLTTILEKGSLDVKTLLNICCQMVDSLKTVHSSGRTYNDIKPDNIMVDDNDAILIDFGMTDKYVD